jgi:hypothetical protein
LNIGAACLEPYLGMITMPVTVVASVPIFYGSMMTMGYSLLRNTPHFINPIIVTRFNPLFGCILIGGVNYQLYKLYKSIIKK